MTQAYFERQDQCGRLLQRQHELEEALQTNIDLVTLFKARSESYAHDVEQLRQIIHELQQQNEGLQRRVIRRPVRTYLNILNIPYQISQMIYF
ncbi:hypothetical protein [Bifidobacterium stellenboschense]|uniref:hypothetical protein n=1 Tax=Bifidobacterium stellenboschense TaxID=762211 RepID=UPI001EE7183A|nr:hypothetical protein [Bifidobacterium stellenboschense]